MYVVRTPRYVPQKKNRDIFVRCSFNQFFKLSVKWSLGKTTRTSVVKRRGGVPPAQPVGGRQVTGGGRSLGGNETRYFAPLACQRSMTRGGAPTYLRAQPFDHTLTILASEYVSMSRRFLGIEPYITRECPRCGAGDMDTRHARMFARSGSQINQHQHLVHTMATVLKRVAVKHIVAGGVLWHGSCTDR